MYYTEWIATSSSKTVQPYFLKQNLDVDLNYHFVFNNPNQNVWHISYIVKLTLFRKIIAFKSNIKVVLKKE